MGRQDESLPDVDAALDAGLSVRDAARAFGMSKSAVHRYAQGRAGARVTALKNAPRREVIDVLLMPRAGLLSLWSRCSWTSEENVPAIHGLLFGLAAELNGECAVLNSLSDNQIARGVARGQRRASYPPLKLAGDGLDFRERIRATFDAAQKRWAESHVDDHDDLEMRMAQFVDSRNAQA